MPRALRASLAWLAVGFGLVAILAACQLSVASVTLRSGPSKLAWGAVDHVLTGFGASLLEEIIFRGLVLRMFYTATRRPWLAILLKSLFFAYIHFKIPPSAAIYAEGGSLWSASFFAAYWLLAGIVTSFDLNRFLSLALLGMVLGTLTLRSGSLWPAIGLHAGLVAAMLTYRDCCILGPAASKGFWGSTALIDGWAADIALALVLVFIVAAKRARITTGPRLGLGRAG